MMLYHLYILTDQIKVSKKYSCFNIYTNLFLGGLCSTGQASKGKLTIDIKSEYKTVCHGIAHTGPAP